MKNGGSAASGVAIVRVTRARLMGDIAIASAIALVSVHFPGAPGSSLSLHCASVLARLSPRARRVYAIRQLGNTVRRRVICVLAERV